MKKRERTLARGFYLFEGGRLDIIEYEIVKLHQVIASRINNNKIILVMYGVVTGARAAYRVIISIGVGV